MTAVEIVTSLLLADAAIGGLVPEAQIKAGRLPDGVQLPALLAREISRTERQKLKREGKVMETSRIQVTVRAATYREQKRLIGLVVSACAGRTGNVAGGLHVATLAAGTGPDLIGDGGIFEQSTDIRVTHLVDA